MVFIPSILIYGHDDTLLDTRRWVLEKAGFSVATATEMTSVIEAVAEQPPKLLVLCHTLTREERNAVLTSTAQRRVEIRTLSFCTNCPASDEDGSVDQTLDNFSGAEKLIAAARRLVEQIRPGSYLGEFEHPS